MESLPEEILLEIVEYLDQGPPSTTRDFHHPSDSSLSLDEASTPLKQLSLVSRRWRRVVFPILFRNLHFALEKLFITEQIPAAPWKRLQACLDFPPFVRKCLDAVGKIESLVVHTTTDFAQLDRRIPDDFREIGLKLWNLIQDYVNPKRLVVLAPPATVAALTSCPTWMSDAWSFTIPFQRIELLQADAADVGSLEDRHAWTTAGGSAVDMEGILPVMFPWHSMRYDEGSSLNNYGSYHYFEKKPPCIVTRRSTQLIRLGHWLRTFTYTAIFPHFDSFFDVMSTVGKFHALRNIVLQLAPHPDSQLLNDTHIVNRGNMNLLDCWSEVERCYALAISALVKTHGWEYPNCWAFSLRALETFESLDCTNPPVQDDLRRLFASLAPDWHETDHARWRNPLPRETPERSKVA